MYPIRFALLGVAAAASVACAAQTGSSPSTQPGSETGLAQSETSAPPPPAPTPSTVTVRGQVVGTGGGGVGGVEVLRVPADAYLLPILRTQTDASGSFVLDGVAGNAREWFVFQQAGYVALYQAFDTTGGSGQTIPAATLLSNDEGAALAQGFGVVLDPKKSVVRVPVTVASAGQTVPAAAGDFEITFEPPLDVPVHFVEGEAIAFNVASTGTYQVKVTRAGQACAPAAHPTLVAGDGSVPIGAQAGYWTIGPTMSCK
jgi:hypothetical protein